MSSLAAEGNTGTVTTDEDKIVEWRRGQLENAGMTTIHAQRIAEKHTGPDAYDLHEVIEQFRAMREKGADPHVAADIII